MATQQKKKSWTHPICRPCWNEKNPDHRAPFTALGEMEVCGWCGRVTCSGIYLRHDPEAVPYPAYEEAA